VTKTEFSSALFLESNVLKCTKFYRHTTIIGVLQGCLRLPTDCCNWKPWQHKFNRGWKLKPRLWTCTVSCKKIRESKGVNIARNIFADTWMCPPVATKLCTVQ